jgi:glycosyltransferase involved in cell wall biosynthesis
MSKKLKIAIVSKLWEETNQFSRGGTGSSLGILVDGLVAKGHHITLFATGDSKTSAQELCAVRPSCYRGDYSEVHEYQNIAAAFKRHKEFDIIHCAVEQKSVLFGGLVETPSLHSIRYGEFFDQEIKLLNEYKDLNFVGISNAVQEMLPFLNWQGMIYNGINHNNFISEKEHGDYLLFLARVTPQKGIDIAIAAAKKLGMKLIVAGKTSATDQEFLDKEFFPYVDGDKIVYLGEVLGEEKKRLLSKAYCLIQPNRLPEACGNTFLEAMASSLPVITFDAGAGRELIDDGKTGFVVNDLDGIIKAIPRIREISKEACLERVKKHFSSDKMVSQYEDLYYKLIG